jgi:TolB-like protein
MPLKSTISIIIALFTVASVPCAVLAQEAVAVDSVVDAAIVPADSAAVPAYVPPVPTAHTKYVAVVETDVDEHSGAAAELSRADVRLVTAELRREAVKNLPRGRFNVMTTETVYAQGTATLLECAEENCVIALGTKIGADFIVRGTISKMETRYTLSVEIYETDDGNLVASSDPVRSETIGGLVENASAACAEMYRSFAEAQRPAHLFDGQGVYAENALRAVWVKVGAGIDLDVTRTAYLRAEALYGARTSNWFETDNSEKPRLGYGLTVKAGAGFRM